jgi:acyl-CoA thioesterase FadM
VDFVKGETVLARGMLTSVCVSVRERAFKAMAIPDVLRNKLDATGASS